MNIKQNEKIKQFEDLTLSEYLKKEIQHIKNYQNNNYQNENTIFEETKINSLETNKSLL